MTKESEYKNLVNHIPHHNDYPNAKLQLSIPTTSDVDPADAMEIVHEYALTKGWKIEEITIIRKSGYIACKDCKKSLHIHISSAKNVVCMNCTGKNFSKTEAEIDIIEND